MGEINSTNNPKNIIYSTNNHAIKKHNSNDVANPSIEHYRKTNEGALIIWDDNDMNVHYNKGPKNLYFKDSDKNGKYDIQDMTYADSQKTVINLNENENNVKDIQDKFKTEFEAQYESEETAKTHRNTIPDGKIEHFRQRPSATGAADCWLLTGVIAINSADKGKTFETNIKPKDQGATVNLVGAGEVYNVSKEQLKNTPPIFVIGDADVKAIEVAVAKHRLNILKSGNFDKEKENALNENLKNRVGDATVENPLKNGTIEEAFFLLAGKKSENYFKLSEFDKLKMKYGIGTSQLFEEGLNPNINFDPNTPLILKEKYPQRYAMGAIFAKDNSNISADHAYAISKVEKDSVTIVNSYNSSKEIKIAKKEFLENIRSITACDLKK